MGFSSHMSVIIILLFFMFVHLVRDVEQPALSYELKVNAYLMLKWSKLC